jgi:hypothetical protein
LGIGPSAWRSDHVGKLVQFEKRGKGRGTAPPDPSSSAEILIFTGVRYEREGSTVPPKPTASSGGKRKRG